MISPATGLEKYEILRELATSDFAATYKAVLRGTQKTVAVHALKPSPATATDPSVILRAAIAARALNSPYIVHVLEASESDGTIYVVTDYAEGSLLSTAIESANLADWDIADLSRQVCSALDHAASLNVSHPNLHPGNIIQEWDGTVKLMDYGITVNALHRANCHSEERSDEESLPSPQSRPITTTLHYLSPEQTRGLAPDRRSNIFSFGVILYEFVTGKKPFSANEIPELLDQIANATPPAPHTVKRGVHPGLSPILMKALAKSPAERYQTGAELLQALDHYKDNAAPTHKPVVPVTAPKPVPPISNAPTAPPPPPSPSSPISVKPASRPAAPTTPPRPSAPSAPVAVPRPTRAPLAPPSGLTPTPASEFIIVGKPFNPDEAPAPAPVQPPSTPAPAKAPVSAPKSPAKGSPKKSNALVLVAVAVSALVLLCLAVAGFVLFRNRTKPAPSNPQQLAAVQPAPTQPSELEPQDTTSNPGPDVSRKKKSAAVPTAAAAPVPILGNLDISSVPDGASVELDGKPLQGLTPHLAPGLQPGSHTIRIAKPGYDSVAQTVTVEAGQTARAHAQLTESRATVALNSDPEGALISINGEKSNRSTPATVALLKGKYIVALSKPGYVPSETILEVAPGQSYKLFPHLSPLGNADAIKETGKLKKLFGGGDRMDQMGKLQFRTNPKGATVSVNGKPMKKTTPMELFFPGGHYELTISLPGYKSVHKTITVTENTAQSIDLQLERE